MKRRKRLSPAHRAAIRRGLARARRAAEKIFQRRSAAAKQGWRTRRIREQYEEAKRAGRALARKEKAAARMGKRRAAVSTVRGAVEWEVTWEVTIRYSKGKEVSDITIRVTAPAGSDRASILGALWRARAGHALTLMHVEGIDWRHGGRDHAYGVDALEADGFGALLKHHVLRVEPVSE